MATFEEAVLARVTATPKLVSDVVESLRDAGWRNVSRDGVERVVRAFGGYVRSRKHGAGAAIYVATIAFDTVTDFKGRTHSVAR